MQRFCTQPRRGRLGFASGIVVLVLAVLGSLLMMATAQANTGQLTIKTVVLGNDALAEFDFPLRLQCASDLPPFASFDSNGNLRFGPLPTDATVKSYGGYILVGGTPLFDADFTGPGPEGFGATLAGTKAVIDANFAAVGSYLSATVDPVNGLTHSSGSGGFVVLFGVRVYDYRTPPAQVPAGAILGTVVNIGASYADLVLAAASYTAANRAIVSRAVVAAVVAAGPPIYVVWDWPAAPRPQNQRQYFDTTFTMRAGGTRTFSTADVPKINSTSTCELVALDNRGGVTTYLSTVAGAAPRPGVDDGVYRSAITKMFQTITVAHRWYGDLVVSTVVSGNPRSHVAIFEIAVDCGTGGPIDRFLLRDGQSKVYSDIPAGTKCVITEPRSDGATVSFRDNTGVGAPVGSAASLDGIVVIKPRTAACDQIGSPSNVAPGGPTPTTASDGCITSVIIRNDYGAVEPSPLSRASAPPVSMVPAQAVNTVPVQNDLALSRDALPVDAPPIDAGPALAIEAAPAFTG